MPLLHGTSLVEVLLPVISFPNFLNKEVKKASVWTLHVKLIEPSPILFPPTAKEEEKKEEKKEESEESDDDMGFGLFD